MRVDVLDASADPTVTSGIARYVLMGDLVTWVKTSEGESMDMDATISTLYNKTADDTDDIANEGAVNLWFTPQRAIDAVGGAKNDVGIGTDDLWSAAKILSTIGGSLGVPFGESRINARAPATGYSFNGTSDCACDIALDADYGAAGNALSMQIACVQVMPTAPGNNVCLAVFTSVPLASDDLTSALLFYVEATTGKFCVRLYGTDGVSYREVKSTGSIYNATLRFDMVHVAISGAGDVSVWMQDSVLTFDAATTSGGSAPASFSEVKSTAYLSIAEAPASVSMAHYGGKVYGVSLFNLAISAADVSASQIDPTYLRSSIGNRSISIDDAADDDTSQWISMDASISFDTDHYEITQVNNTQFATWSAADTQKVGIFRISVEVKDGTATGVPLAWRTSAEDPSVDRGPLNASGILSGNETFATTSSWVKHEILIDAAVAFSVGDIVPEESFVSLGSDIELASGGDTATGNYEIRNFKFERLGCFADWPMNEGIGYLLHDRSPNCYHGVLAASTGWTQPKTEGVIKGRVSFAAESSTKNLIADKRLLPTNARILSIEAEVAGGGLQNFSIGDGTSNTRWAASGNGTAGFKVITPANRAASGTTDAVNKVTVTPAASATMTVDLWIKYRVDPQV